MAEGSARGHEAKVHKAKAKVLPFIKKAA